MANSEGARRGRPVVGWLSVLLVGLLLTACGPAAPVGPLGFSLDYPTSSIPPPYDYQYTLDVVFDDDEAQVD